MQQGHTSEPSGRPKRQAGRGILSAASPEERIRAVRKAKRHSLLVKFLKGALPLCAVGSLVLYATQSKFTLTVAGQKVEVDRISTTLDNFKMVNPKMEGFTKDRGRYRVNAENAIINPKKPNQIDLNIIKARINQTNGDWVKLVAHKGRFNRQKEELYLTKGIQIDLNDGTKARLNDALVKVRDQHIVTKRPVAVTMLNGKVRANRMELWVKKKVVEFTGGVVVDIRKLPSGRAEGKAKVQKAPAGGKKSSNRSG